ncbi:DNA gyrase subunit A [Candidatus Fermentibacteria bacterium]|nr:DNA gyrase subunit A [Candidatus Fermentibacteria bacterium]
MDKSRERVLPIFLEDEMKSSYLDYSMSVIVQRALPDARDGLKPSQRRILVAMNDLGLAPNKAHRKCAKIAGDTSGNYHPHGEQVIYPTLVRMAQEWAMRYPLVEGQGNFGSIDGDAPAAMRYTEARLSPIAMEVLRDLDKETVDFTPNYDDTRVEPRVLPGAFPNLICNGGGGIAVGMATNLPPHNLTEVVNALITLIERPDVDDEALLRLIPGPDFPTGGIVYGRAGIRDAYLNGQGKIIVRARAAVETRKGARDAIIVTEIPYQVNKNTILERIAELVRTKRIEGIADLRDESDRDGMRIVIEMKKDAVAQVVLNQLYKHTQMQETFGAIMLSLVNGKPKVMSLRALLEHHLSYRHDVVVRRTTFELAKARDREHVLIGVRIALDHLDRVIALIRASADTAEAKSALMTAFGLSDKQATAILEMRLQRLTGLERQKIDDELAELAMRIRELERILASREAVMEVVRTELAELGRKFGDERRTEIVEDSGEFQIEDLIADEDMVITISREGYIKRLPVNTYRRQHRGGRGISGMGTKDEDFVRSLFVARTHSYILFFSDKGKCYWLKVHQIPPAGRLSRGKAIVNLLAIEPGEKIKAMVPVAQFTPGTFIVMATRQGFVKKTDLMAFSNPRRMGILAIGVRDGDELIDAELTDGQQDVILATSSGLAIRFPEAEVRDTGRGAQGVIGIRMRQSGDWVIGMVIVRREASLLVVSENGFGKRTTLSDYRVTHRGGQGVATLKTAGRNGSVIGMKEVVDDEELMLITRNGVIIRLPVSGVRIIGRNTQGVRLINLDPGDQVIDVERVVGAEEEPEEGEDELSEEGELEGDQS